MVDGPMVTSTPWSLVPCLSLDFHAGATADAAKAGSAIAWGSVALQFPSLC